MIYILCAIGCLDYWVVKICKNFIFMFQYEYFNPSQKKKVLSILIFENNLFTLPLFTPISTGFPHFLSGSLFLPRLHLCLCLLFFFFFSFVVPQPKPLFLSFNPRRQTHLRYTTPSDRTTITNTASSSSKLTHTKPTLLSLTEPTKPTLLSLMCSGDFVGLSS